MRCDDDTEIVRKAMAELAANLSTPTEITAVLEAVTSLAVQLIPAVDFADVLLVDEHEHRTVAPTDPLAVDLDSLQLDLQEGPCLGALVEDATIVAPDLANEVRWPRFSEAAASRGVASMMAFRLYTYPKATPRGIGGRGALNLFSRSQCEFDLEDQALGGMLATHAATALVAADRQRQFESALASRDVIGQAKGVLMERFKVDAVRAFAMMTKLSQDSNTPIRVLAQRIVDST
ncbi:GAF and ANTAR domain-containing protein [Mycolicibacterium gadium]|uniref:ANTAR domain-containing protein n=1 Tax=Mycolicibacterium gadium TaxID=1794 RepID=A0A7I7WHD0_MYCGU|nr:GAF and ANTAR domain-containing protein [Mycolicibacterium gadium]BBZ16312.1 hypothetical protein MGAD_06470 [Mycolicibacterium gadium]